ncbi:MAG: hypothetical protein AB7F96_05560 [Beijerinckiaceae bacterium]
MERFSPYTRSQLGFYVYRLIDPEGKTFYVGKGKGNRLFDHIRMKVDESAYPDGMPLKFSKIREIKDSGKQIGHVIHRFGLTKAEALEVEAALIDAYEDLTNLQRGHHTKEKGIRTAEEIEQYFAREKVEIGHKVLFVNVARSLANKEEKDRNNYDAARFAWVLNEDRAQKCEYVLAHKDGVVIDIFKPEKWLPATPENFKELTAVEIRSKRGHLRLGFEGIQVDDPAICARYKNKRVPEKLARPYGQSIHYMSPNTR